MGRVGSVVAGETLWACADNGRQDPWCLLTCLVLVVRDSVPERHLKDRQVYAMRTRDSGTVAPYQRLLTLSASEPASTNKALIRYSRLHGYVRRKAVAR